MKTGRWLLLALLLLLIGSLVVVSVPLFRDPRVSGPVRDVLPAAPLIYLECPRLQTWWTQAATSESLRRFRQSDAAQQFFATAAWQTFTANVQAAVRALWLDPFRLVGAEVAAAVYAPQPQEAWPGVLIVTRLDGVARVAERLLGAVDLAAANLTIDVERETAGIAVQKVTLLDAEMSFYYAVINDLALLATSPRLLDDAIQRARRGSQSAAESSALPAMLTDVPDSRILTTFWHPAKLLTSLTRNANLRTVWQQLDQAMLRQWAALPPTALALDHFSNGTRLTFAWLPPSGKVTARALFPAELPAEIGRPDAQRSALPLVIRASRTGAAALAKTGARLWPQPFWADFLSLTKQRELFGDELECRLASRLGGLAYTLPDLLCLAQTRLPPEQVRPALQNAVTTLLIQQFPPFMQQSMIKQLEELYQGALLNRVQIAFQDVLGYTVIESAREEGGFYLLVATMLDSLKTKVAAFQADSALPPFALALPVAKERRTSALRLHLQPELAATLLTELAATQTFQLLLPPRQYSQFYQWLPLLSAGLQSLPPVWGEIIVQPPAVTAHLLLEADPRNVLK